MKSTRTAFAAGVALGALAAWGLSAFGPVAARVNRAAPATGTVVLENDRVRVKDVTFPPGVMDTGMHTHDLPHVGVILQPGALVFTEPGKAAETVAFQAGSVGYREANVTHQVANPGRTPMRVIEVELK